MPRNSKKAAPPKPRTLKDVILKLTADQYLQSNRFNGFPVRNLLIAGKLSPDDIRHALQDLIEADKVSLVFGDIFPNPHIKAFDPEPAAQQLKKLAATDFSQVCAYPSPKHLKTIAKPGAHAREPFTRLLALGEPQLKPAYFDLHVLELYRNDPRFHFSHNDVGGDIHLSDKYAKKIKARDNVFLQTFGFGFDKKLNRGVAVFLWYLSRLSPEHQQLWNARILRGKFYLHPDYFRTAIEGNWPEGVSLFDAFLEEQRVLNKMADAMGRKPLFRETFDEDSRPREFAFLLRPTKKEFEAFTHLLDKLLSENINKEFFAGEVTDTEEETRRDGTKVVRNKGTLRMLEEWLAQNFEADDKAKLKKALDTLKAIRGLRQKPAHGIRADEYDEKIFKRQRQLMMDAYGALRFLRKLIASHPDATNVAVDPKVQAGKIWTY